MKRNDYHIDVGQLPSQISRRLQRKPSEAPGDINDKVTDVAQQAVACLHSELWNLLCRADQQSHADRKPVSHYGALPRRAGPDEANAWGDWIDPGNFHYTRMLPFLEQCALAEGSETRLDGLHALTNSVKVAERGGDICEAVLGTHIRSHFAIKEYWNEAMWYSEKWNLNMKDDTQYAIARFILLHLSIQDLFAADGLVRPDSATMEEQAEFIYGLVQPKMDEVMAWWGTSPGGTARSYAGKQRQAARDARRKGGKGTKSGGKGSAGKGGGKTPTQPTEPPRLGLVIQARAAAREKGVAEK